MLAHFITRSSEFRQRTHFLFDYYYYRTSEVKKRAEQKKKKCRRENLGSFEEHKECTHCTCAGF